MSKITLATLPQASAQEVFDQAVQHLVKQGRPSINGRSCAYRAEGGFLACAAGCFIDDTEYDSGIEGYGWYHLTEEGIAPKAHGQLITELQEAHDFSAQPQAHHQAYPFLDRLRERLAGVAQRHGLKYNPEVFDG